MTKIFMVLASILCASAASAEVQNWKCTGQLPVQNGREVLELSVMAYVPLEEAQPEIFTEVYTVFDERHSDQAPAGRYTLDYSATAHLIQRTKEGTVFSMFHPWGDSAETMKRFTVDTTTGVGSLYFPASGESAERTFSLTCAIPAHQSPLPQN